MRPSLILVISISWWQSIVGSRVHTERRVGGDVNTYRLFARWAGCLVASATFAPSSFGRDCVLSTTLAEHTFMRDIKSSCNATRSSPSIPLSALRQLANHHLPPIKDIPGDIISTNSLAACSTCPVRCAHVYHSSLICRTIGAHLSFLKVCEIRSKKLRY